MTRFPLLFVLLVIPAALSAHPAPKGHAEPAGDKTPGYPSYPQSSYGSYNTYGSYSQSGATVTTWLFGFSDTHLTKGESRALRVALVADGHDRKDVQKAVAALSPKAIDGMLAKLRSQSAIERDEASSVLRALAKLAPRPMRERMVLALVKTADGKNPDADDGMSKRQASLVLQQMENDILDRFGQPKEGQLRRFLVEVETNGESVRLPLSSNGKDLVGFTPPGPASLRRNYPFLAMWIAEEADYRPSPFGYGAPVSAAPTRVRIRNFFAEEHESGYPSYGGYYGGYIPHRGW